MAATESQVAASGLVGRIVTESESREATKVPNGRHAILSIASYGMDRSAEVITVRVGRGGESVLPSNRRTNTTAA